MEISRRSAQLAGINEFARQQKEESRRRLIEAAERVFNRLGYIAPTVDDIAQEAGVSRQTFYRHFDGKVAIAMEYFERHNAKSMPLWLKIAEQDYTNPTVVSKWITMLFDYNEAHRQSLRAFVEMGTVEPAFVERFKRLVPTIIDQLGKKVPVFAAARGKTLAARRQWIDTWLFFYHLREQCSMNATGFMDKDRPIVIAAFTQGFLDLFDIKDAPRARRKPTR
jgi:AcrR family transcriptional regulator